MLEEGILSFSDEQVDRMHTKTLEDLLSYYDDVLTAIGGPEIFHLLDRMAKAEDILVNRKNNK